MREIKFRVWQKSVGEFVNIPQEKHEEKCFGVGWLALDLDGTLIYQTKTTYMPVEDPDDFVIRQYTGLKDKNGKEIYEGDIIKYLYHNAQEVTYERVYPYEQCGHYGIGFELFTEAERMEVVGNVFEGVDK